MAYPYYDDVLSVTDPLEDNDELQDPLEDSLDDTPSLSLQERNAVINRARREAALREHNRRLVQQQQQQMYLKRKHAFEDEEDEPVLSRAKAAHGGVPLSAGKKKKDKAANANRKVLSLPLSLPLSLSPSLLSLSLSLSPSLPLSLSPSLPLSLSLSPSLPLSLSPSLPLSHTHTHRLISGTSIANNIETMSSAGSRMPAIAKYRVSCPRNTSKQGPERMRTWRKSRLYRRLQG
jgi:hypothetical protein